MTTTREIRAPFWLDGDAEANVFPDAALALRDPDGLLALGGNLSPQSLINAYSRGIFPWYNEGQPILWWSPDPRTVLFPERLKVSRSLHKTLARNVYAVTLDAAFEAVINACAEPRKNSNKTWITAAMKAAYCQLYRMGIAHSVETWYDGTLVGGMYGIALGRVFFGESMFSRRANASKVAVVHLMHWLKSWGYALLDCQCHSDHMVRFGATSLPRDEFIALLNQWCLPYLDAQQTDILSQERS
jgi:leucyl/phenylalanyl-tRNA--protein transferase